MLMGRIWIS